MTKIGHTDGSVYSMFLQQLIVEPLFGNKLVMNPSQSGASGESIFSVSAVPTNEKVEIDRVVKAVLNAMSHLACAVGRGQSVSVEKLPFEEDEEAKYIITIKKPKTGGDL